MHYSKNFKFILPFLLLFAKNIHAQFQGNVFKQNINAPVVVAADTILNAWDGGYNSLEVVNADLNNDGIADLVLYDNNTNAIKTYINIGSAGNIKYQYQPKYAANFPACRSFLKLQDYNCDGVPDLFERGDFGVAIHKGAYVNNELTFTFYKDIWFTQQSGQVNLYTQLNDIPEIKDMDGDGDLDVLAFDVFGTVLNYYKNTRVETGAPCDSFNVVFETNCWGHFIQGYYMSVFLNGSCKGFSPVGTQVSPANEQYNDLDTATDFTKYITSKRQRHSGNCIVSFDENGDGNLDLIGSNVSFNTVQVLYNNSNTNPLIYAQDTTYKNIDLATWPAPFYTDIDNDGKKDLVLSPHLETVTNTQWAEVNKAIFYKNIGTTAIPNFQYQNDNLFFNQTIDLGAYSYPTFYDYNKDGKPDLFIGSQGTLDTSDSTLRAKISYFQNTSDSGHISFKLITNDFLNLSLKHYKGLFPTFGDVTGDGITDLIIGSTNGKIMVFKNTAPADQAPPQFQYLSDYFQNININSNIPGDTNNFTFPAVYDVNHDGKNDIILGTGLGNLYLFEDSSTVLNTSKFWLKTNNLANIRVGGNVQFNGYSAPTVCKTDNMNKKYLVIGTGDGTIERYDSIQSLNSIYGPYPKIDSFYNNLHLPYRAVPAFADIDGDGKMDMVIGNRTGGVYLYNQSKTITDSTTGTDTTTATNNINKANNCFLVYPNPANDNLFFKANVPNQLPFDVYIYNTTGQLLVEKQQINSTTFELNISNFAKGIYTYKIVSAKNTKSGIILKQ